LYLPWHHPWRDRSYRVGNFMKPPTESRTIRRLRAQFRKELLGDAKPTPSDQALIDLAAQAGLRVKEMRAELSAGRRVPDEDLVRISNTVNRIMREFRGRAVTAKPKLTVLQEKMIADGKAIIKGGKFTLTGK
jgi:hypothetical protein